MTNLLLLFETAEVLREDVKHVWHLEHCRKDQVALPHDEGRQPLEMTQHPKRDRPK